MGSELLWLAQQRFTNRTRISEPHYETPELPRAIKPACGIFIFIFIRHSGGLKASVFRGGSSFILDVLTGGPIIPVLAVLFTGAVGSDNIIRDKFAYNLSC